MCIRDRGLPFFSAGVAGLAILKSPTIGYIIGFFLAAYAIGQFADRPVIGILFGSLIIYFCGVVGLILILNTSLQNAITLGVVPFIIGDFIKSFLAIAVAYKLK